MGINGVFSVGHSTEDWVKHGQELRRPLLVHPSISDGKISVIIGGGLSGMTVGYQIAKKNPERDVVILERGGRLGGVIETWSRDDWLCDVAVSSARPHPAFWRLVDELELGESFFQSRIEAKQRWLFIDGEYVKLDWKVIFRIGVINLLRSIIKSRKGGLPVSNLIPDKSIADGITLGIVNQYSDDVDADFLFPSMTKFGEGPSLGYRRLARKIRGTYPLFTPRKGAFGSFDNGMEVLIDKLGKKLNQMPNVSVQLHTEYDSLSDISEVFGVSKESIIWSSPGILQKQKSSEVAVFVVGYRESNTTKIPVGYGTLFPQPDIVISGILHESDVHVGRRAPPGHRLFRVMVPVSSWSGDEQEIMNCLKEIFVSADPVIFEKIGHCSIPSYEPGYMRRISETKLDFSITGWGGSGVSIVHVVDEAERISEMF